MPPALTRSPTFIVYFHRSLMMKYISSPYRWNRSALRAVYSRVTRCFRKWGRRPAAIMWSKRTIFSASKSPRRNGKYPPSQENPYDVHSCNHFTNAKAVWFCPTWAWKYKSSFKKKQLTIYLCEDVPTLPPNILLFARTKRKIPLRKIFGYWRIKSYIYSVGFIYPRSVKTWVLSSE